VQAKAEHLRELVGGEPEQSEVAAAFEEFVDGEIAAKHEVAAVFDLLERGMTTEIDGSAVFLRKLRSYHPSPVIELLANQLGRIGYPEKGIIVLTKLHAGALEFAFDEM
jgi:hypothetical protein